MSRKKQTPGPVPDRWLYCPRKAEDLIVGKFMALKTPLSSDFDSQVPPECRFTPKMFFDTCKIKKIEIGLWIDLTYTSRFYDRSEVDDHNCRYIKISCRGHGEAPSPEETRLFIKTVSDFISKNPLHSIAVHCTHGFNRTGFLIVCYLIEEMDFDLDSALQEFAKRRPVGIYKQDYIAELYTRYGDIEDMPPAPDRPKWCLESDDSNGCNDSEASTSSIEFEDASAYLPGVKGVYVFKEEPKKSLLQKKIQRMCRFEKKGFPGSQPVSMNHENISLLSKAPYRVSWKADGTRFMMLIDGEKEVYLFDRDNRVFKVTNLRFLHSKNLSHHLQNTLLDGEMVIDKVNGQDIPRYLVYDIVSFESENVGDLPFLTRLDNLDKEIIRPRYIAMERGMINKSIEPFSVRKKDFWEINQAGSLLGEKFAKALSHEPDGLIFQPSKEPYTPGRCDLVLKWKPLELNSIDFRLKISKITGPGIIPKKIGLLYVGQLNEPFGKMDFTKALQDLDGKIIECKSENRKWKFMRERTDKSFPNSYTTAEAVQKTIDNPLTKEFLLKYIQNNRYGLMRAPDLPHSAKRLRAS